MRKGLLYRRRMMQASGGLPPEYLPVECMGVQTGRNAYFVENRDISRTNCRILYRAYSSNTSDNYIIGTIGNTFYAGTWNNKYYIGISGWNTASSPAGAVAVNKSNDIEIIIQNDNYKVFIDGVKQIDYTKTRTGTITSYRICNGGNYQFRGGMYYMHIIDENYELYYLPCQEISTGVYGFYDMINRVFRASEGNGLFEPATPY